MNLKPFDNIYFVGVGGIGMSALANYFHKKNIKVSGYDKTQTKITDSLISMGIKIVFSDDYFSIDKEHMNPENTLVIITPAIPKSNSILTIPKSCMAVEEILSTPFSLFISFSKGLIILSVMISGEFPG